MCTRKRTRVLDIVSNIPSQRFEEACPRAGNPETGCACNNHTNARNPLKIASTRDNECKIATKPEPEVFGFANASGTTAVYLAGHVCLICLGTGRLEALTLSTQGASTTEENVASSHICLSEWPAGIGQKQLALPTNTALHKELSGSCLRGLPPHLPFSATAPWPCTQALQASSRHTLSQKKLRASCRPPSGRSRKAPEQGSSMLLLSWNSCRLKSVQALGVLDVQQRAAPMRFQQVRCAQPPCCQGKSL